MGPEIRSSAGRPAQGTQQVGHEFGMGTIPSPGSWPTTTRIRIQRRHSPDMGYRLSADRAGSQWPQGLRIMRTVGRHWKDIYILPRQDCQSLELA